MPGAEVLERVSDDKFIVAVSIRVGPAAMRYRSEVKIVERDAAARSAVLAITAREVHGQGSASATSSVRIGQNGTGTQVALGTDVQLNGKVAGLGQSVIQSVSERLVGQFAQNLAATFTAEQQGANGSGRAASSALLGAVNGVAGTNRVGNDTPDDPAPRARRPAAHAQATVRRALTAPHLTQAR